MNSKEEYKKINTRFALTYLSILISVQAAGLFAAIRLTHHNFLALFLTVVILGTAWPLMLHQVLYNLMIKRAVRRLSST